MELQFWGAAQTVSGSDTLLMLNNRILMVDCGLYQGSRQRAREINLEFPVDPGAVDAVILTHAHIDHSGNIPALVAKGYRGHIYCTPGTMDLTRVLLRDSGHIQEKDAEFLNRRFRNRPEMIVPPLYTLADAERALPLLRPEPYGREFELLSGAIRATFRDAGHILGSAWVDVVAREGDQERRIVFSGDVGRKNMPILRDPELPDDAEVLVMESTYGTRLHDDYALAEEKLLETIRRVIDRRGKVIIPAFSVGRTQEIVYALNNLWNAGKLRRIPIYVDSPLSVNATEVFRHHPECYDEETKQIFVNDPDPFGFEGLIYVRDAMLSRRLNELKTPCVIISASGMMEAGRVLHHLANNIEDPRNAILVVGFQAENTLGRRLVEKQAEVKILGEPYEVKAEVVTFNAFSAHADSKELREFAAAAAKGGKLRKLFLVHGEAEQMEGLQALLKQDLPGCDVIIPHRGERFSI